MADEDRITIRGVAPEDARTLDTAAAARGFASRNAYLANLVHTAAAHERNNAALTRVADLPTTGLGSPDTAAAVRALRDELATGEQR